MWEISASAALPGGIWATHRLTPHQHVDYTSESVFSDAAPDAFIAAGYSARFTEEEKERIGDH